MRQFRIVGIILIAGLTALSYARAEELAPPAMASPQTAPATASPQSHGAAVAPDYQIGPGDTLEINVWKEPDMSASSLPVRPDGMISLPIVGDIPASGSTAMHLSSVIVERLKKYITDPTVTVTVLGVNSKRIYLIGEVMKPGEEPLLPGLNLLQAIASAGGLTPYANSKHIYILRGAAGKQQKIPFNYKAALKNGNLQGITLQPGDTIVVP